MRIATYNIRFDSMPDGVTVQQTLDSLPDPLREPLFLATTAEEPWSVRRIRLVEQLLCEDIVLAGLQEVLIRQVNDLDKLLGEKWSWIGVGRDDGVTAGEFSPIFYKRTAMKHLSNDYFWLSNTPFLPSKFPGAGSIRICTAARFSLTTEGNPRKFTILNTHLDDQSDDQRRLAASLLLVRARFEAATNGNPVLITGDFNSPSTGPDSGAYRIITGAQPPVPIDHSFAAKFAVPDGQLPDFKMVDLRGSTPRRNVSVNYATFTGFTLPTDTSQWTRIDFIFGGTNLGWTTSRYTVGTSLSDDGILASDHRPVFVDVSI